jgi:hypothetical protein
MKNYFFSFNKEWITAFMLTRAKDKIMEIKKWRILIINLETGLLHQEQRKMEILILVREDKKIKEFCKISLKNYLKRNSLV